MKDSPSKPTSKRVLVRVQTKDSDEIISLPTAMEKFHLDLYDSEALRRGHTLNYPNFIIGPFESSEEKKC